MSGPFPYRIKNNEVTLSEAQMGAMIAAAEARGREQGRREAIERLRKVAEQARYECDRDGARMCVRFLESTGGQL